MMMVDVSIRTKDADGLRARIRAERIARALELLDPSVVVHVEGVRDGSAGAVAWLRNMARPPRRMSAAQAVADYDGN